MCLYVDGQKMPERAYPGELAGFGKYFYFGASHNRWSFRPPKPDTVIDEVRIYNRRLSDGEIKAIYQEYNLPEINKAVPALSKEEAAMYTEPLVDVIATPAPPVIDGTVNPEEWRYATGISGMISMNLGAMTTRQARFLFCFDQTNFYLALLSPIPAGEKLAGIKSGKRDDGGICTQDSIEIYLDPLKKGEQSNLYHFIGNYLGDIFDRKGLDGGWNGNWVYRSTVTGSLWSVELAIPFKDLGVSAPADGEVWGFNACRTFSGSGESWSSWVRGVIWRTEKAGRYPVHASRGLCAGAQPGRSRFDGWDIHLENF